MPQSWLSFHNMQYFTICKPPRGISYPQPYLPEKSKSYSSNRINKISLNTANVEFKSWVQPTNVELHLMSTHLEGTYVWYYKNSYDIIDGEIIDLSVE